MATFQDASLGLSTESTYKTYVAPTRFYEFTDESLNWEKNTVQGQGLRVGSRVARSGRRVITSGQGGGDFTVEAISKGMGLLWQACLGTGTSTVVSGATYQQVFTLGDAPSSLTLQKGIPQVGGTVDALTFTGCMVTDWELTFGNTEIAALKVSVDAGDYSTAQSYAAPSYPASPNLFGFQSATLSTGTLTAPTSTVLGSAATPVANVRSGSVSVNHNLAADRFNIGGAGRKSKPTVGLREISGSLEVEYDSTTWRDAFLADSPLSLVLTYSGPGALSTGFETLQVVLPEIKFDGDLPQANGTDLITVSMPITVLDNLTAAQPIWVVTRTADNAL